MADDAMFFAQVFSIGSYMGLQQDFDGARKVRFSIWDATAFRVSVVEGAQCRPFGGEGVGMTCTIPYAWEAGRWYGLRIRMLDSDAEGQWWGAWVLDDARQEQRVGDIRAPSPGLITSTSTFNEYYGWAEGFSCGQPPPSAIHVYQPIVNDDRSRAASSGGGLLRCSGGRVTELWNGELARLDLHADRVAGTVPAQPPVPIDLVDGVDLVVHSPRTDSGLVVAPERSFTFTADVRNLGTESAFAARLDYFRSNDSAISVADTRIGSVPIGGLSASAAMSASLEVKAPAEVGSYYFGACVGGVAQERHSDNNCSTAVRVTFETRTPETRDPDKDFSTLSAAGNNEPYGLWSDGTTMWVSDWLDGKLYAYSMATRERDPGRDFDTLLAAGNDSPRGIWSDGATMWVADFVDRKVYAYSMATRSHAPDKDFDPVRAAGSAGIWADGVTMWVADFFESKLYAHSTATRGHDPDKDFNTLLAAGNHHPEGIWSDGVTMWVTDNGGSGEHAGGPRNKVYAYSIATQSREPSRDLNTLYVAGNHRPRGLWSDGATMWIADVLEDKLYAYHLGGTPGNGLTPEQYERYRETWETTAGGGSTRSSELDPDAAASHRIAFTDHPLRAGTPLKAVHFRELRMRIAALRAREGLPAVQWTDPALAAGVTPIRRVHLTELRAALDTVYEALGRSRPSYTDAAVTAGATTIRTLHLIELRAAVTALE